jgi:hypothetical protein
MGILDETRSVERLQFFDGQRLLATDLQAHEAFNREMRWLHNRSLHQPGIGSGFAVYGAKGDREVSVAAGYAVDAKGRELVLTRTRTEPVPPVAGEPDGQPVFYDLAVSYPDDDDLKEVETREGVCLPSGVVRRREEPAFCWIRLDRDQLGGNVLRPRNLVLAAEIKDGLRVVLARAEVLQCRLHKDLSVAQRRSARPASQPMVACGSVLPAWRLWEFAGERDQEAAPDDPVEVTDRVDLLPVGLKADIDTSSGRFLTTPCYSARIEAPRVFPLRATVAVVADALVNIAEPRPTGFRLYALILAKALGAEFLSAPRNHPEIAKVLSTVGVVWMGVEG